MAQTDISELWKATDDELFTIIGAMALPLIESPSGLLDLGRTGTFFVSGTGQLGEKHGKVDFEHKGFVGLGKKFLKEWGSQLRKAICHDKELSDEISKTTGFSREVAVAAVVSAVIAHIPDLASYSGLLTAIGVLVVKSGIDAFCKMLG